MSVKNIVYAYNFRAQDLSHFLMESIMDMRHVGLSEMTFLQLAPFNGWISALSKRDIKANVLVEQNILSRRVLDVAQKDKASIIIVHLDKRRPLGVRRSIVRNLIAKSSIPLLFINNHGQGQMAIKKRLFENVVIAYNWSDTAHNALNFLLLFEKMINALEIVKVSNAKLTVREIRELKENLAKTRKMCLERGIDAESHIYAGKPSEEIMTAARDYKASLIVLGNNAKRKFSETIFVKNPSYAIATRAPVPVLVIPSPATI
ncbi:MAG: universal stress protein [Deltaproteobacteria bacterium]|nr:universal stress protein [Deltaproteobacteria bacterium]